MIILQKSGAQRLFGHPVYATTNIYWKQQTLDRSTKHIQYISEYLATQIKKNIPFMNFLHLCHF